MNLTEDPEIVQREANVFLYVEKIGPFRINAPVAWREFWDLLPAAVRPTIRAMGGLSYAEGPDPDNAANVYQAGVCLESPPASTPPGMKLRTMDAGRFARFVLTGPYHQLGAAYARAFKTLSERKISRRREFCAEFYLNDPARTPEPDLLTELLIPVS